MMVLTYTFNRDANVFLQGWKCKNLVVQMSSNGYVMMRMLFVRMSWCKCTLIGKSWCKCPYGACHDANALMQTQFIQKFFLFSKRGFLSTWNQNILKAWFIIPEKSSSFWLKALKKLVITVRNLRMEHWLRIWWFGSKRFV